MLNRKDSWRGVQLSLFLSSVRSRLLAVLLQANANVMEPHSEAASPDHPFQSGYCPQPILQSSKGSLEVVPAVLLVELGLGLGRAPGSLPDP